MRVAHAVANRYRERGVALPDLEQAACEGLTKAVHRFDATLHHDLLSLAVPTIRGEVLRHFRDHTWTVRPPRRIQQLQWRIVRATDELRSELGREPAHQEVCLRLSLARAEYDEAVVAFGSFSPPSLDQTVPGTDQLVLGDALADPRTGHGPEEARAVLEPVLRDLSERDRRIIHLRFIEDRTQQEIGQEFGVAQMQVSRWLTRIFAGLREDIGDLVAA